MLQLNNDKLKGVFMMPLSNKNQAIVDSIFVGVTKTLGDATAKMPLDREWTTAIFKEPVDEPIYLGETNLSGDEQADLIHHGGRDKAVFSYPSEHYLYWQEKLNNTTITQGGMGENFSTINLSEATVAIGDIFQVGEAIIQVSQPRQPCWKPARRHRTKELAVLIQNLGRTGWYYRVLQEGWVAAGQPLTLIERRTPEWTIEKCNDVMHHDQVNFERIAQLVEIDTLADSWKTTLQNRLATKKVEAIEKRVYGPNVD